MSSPCTLLVWHEFPIEPPDFLPMDTIEEVKTYIEAEKIDITNCTLFGEEINLDHVMGGYYD